MADFAQILIKATDQTKGAFDSAARNMRGLEDGASRLKGLMGGIGIGAGLSAAGFAAFAKQGIDAADALNDMSDRLGVSVKDLASFKLAAELADTSLEGVGNGIARLTRSIGEAEGGNKKLAGALAELGITARDPKEAFYQLADATKRIEDPSKRAALLSQVLGKSYQELVPLLSQGGEELRKSAKESESFADSMARLAPEAGKLNDELDRLKINAAGASGALLAHMVPTINEVIERSGVLIKLYQTGGFFNGVMMTAGASDYAEVLQRVREEIVQTENAIASKNSRGNDPSAFEEKLRGLNAQLKVLEEFDATRQADDLKKLSDLSTSFWKKPDAGIDTSAATSATTKTKADPLAGLLGSTDIGRIKEFDKQVALLNERFDGGLKSTELYNQAMTKLVETTFAANFSEFKGQMAEQEETQRLVAEHLKATKEELDLQQQAWIDAGQAIEDQYKPGLIKLEERLGYLDELFRRNVISVDAWSAGYADAMDNVGKSTGEAEDTFEKFAESAAKNIQSTLADYLFDPFDQGLQGMLEGFGKTLQRMIADAAAAELAKNLFGDLSGGTGDGWVGAALSAVAGLASFDGGGYTGPGTRTGGVDGKGGFMSILHPNETVVDHSKGQTMGGGTTVVVHVNGSNNAPDVRRAAAQGAREALGMFEGARRYA